MTITYELRVHSKEIEEYDIDFAHHSGFHLIKYENGIPVEFHTIDLGAPNGGVIFSVSSYDKVGAFIVNDKMIYWGIPTNNENTEAENFQAISERLALYEYNSKILKEGGNSVLEDFNRIIFAATLITYMPSLLEFGWLVNGDVNCHASTDYFAEKILNIKNVHSGLGYFWDSHRGDSEDMFEFDDPKDLDNMKIIDKVLDMILSTDVNITKMIQQEGYEQLLGLSVLSDMLNGTAPITSMFKWGDGYIDIKLGDQNYVVGGDFGDTITVRNPSEDYIILGEAGDDHLYGGEGNDRLFGGADNDTYHFSGDFGRDVIIDDSGMNDKISISGNSLGYRFVMHQGQLVVFDVNGKNTVNAVSGAIEKLDFANIKDVDLTSGVQNSVDAKGVSGAYTAEDGVDYLYATGQTGVTIGNGQYGKKYYGTLFDLNLTGISDTPENRDKITTDAMDANGCVRVWYAKGTSAERLLAEVYSYSEQSALGKVQLSGGAACVHSVSLTSDNDTYFVGCDHGVSVSGGNGDDIIYGGDGKDTLKGGNGADILIGGDGGSLFYGGQTMAGQMSFGMSDTGQNEMRGGTGNDTFYAGDLGDTIYGGGGNDQFHSGQGSDTIYGGAGNDIYFALNVSDTVYDAGGDNIFSLWSDGGAITIVSGAGDDQYTCWAGIYNATITDSGGNNTLSVLGTASGAVFGWVGGRFIVVGGGHNIVVSYFGDLSEFSLFSPYHGQSWTYDVSLESGFVASSSVQQASHETRVESGGPSTVFGSGTIAVKNSSAYGRHYFGQFDFVFESLTVAQQALVKKELLDGTLNNWRVYLDDGSNSGSGVTLAYVHGLDFDNPVGQLSVGEIDCLIRGTDGNDTLIGTSGRDVFDGGLGDDRFEGKDGNDTYRFGFGCGSDTVYDTNGNDAIELAADVTAADVIFSREKNDLILTLSDGSTLRVTDCFLNNSTWNNGYYNTTNNRLIETIRFMNGIDADIRTLDLAELLPTTYTDAGETLYGGADNDHLYSGMGNDHLEGGAGDDHYYVGSTTSGGADRIVDTEGDNVLHIGVRSSFLICIMGEDLVVVNKTTGGVTRAAIGMIKTIETGSWLNYDYWVPETIDVSTAEKIAANSNHYGIQSDVFFIPKESSGRAGSGFAEHVGTVVFGPESTRGGAAPTGTLWPVFALYAYSVEAVRFPTLETPPTPTISNNGRTISYGVYLTIHLLPDPVTGQYADNDDRVFKLAA